MPVCEVYECISEIIGVSLPVLFGAISAGSILAAVLLLAIFRNTKGGR